MIRKKLPVLHQHNIETDNNLFQFLFITIDLTKVRLQHSNINFDNLSVLINLKPFVIAFKESIDLIYNTT